MRPSPLLLGHLLEGPALRHSLGAEVQQRLGPAPAAHSPGPGITLLRSSGAAPAALGRGGVHPAGPGPGRGLLGCGGGSVRCPLRFAGSSDPYPSSGPCSVIGLSRTPAAPTPAPRRAGQVMRPL